MQIYELVRVYRDRKVELLVARIKAEDYDAAIKIAEHIEVLPGVFGDDEVEPGAPMILLTRDYHAEAKRDRKVIGEVRYSESRNPDGSLKITNVEVRQWH